MKLPRLRLRRLLITTCIIGLFSAGVASADVSPSSAGAFYNSVGVDTHLTFANSDYADWTRLLTMVDQLGVKHLADGAYGNPDPAWDWFNNLFATRVEQAVSHGIKFAYEMGKPSYTGGTISQLVSEMAGPLRNSIEAIIDPNEFDTSSGLSNWWGPLNAYDQQLYQAVKANPSLSSLPVIGPSLVNWGSTALLGNESSFVDDGNLHDYTGGTSPTARYLTTEKGWMGGVAGSKPDWATEMGYSTAVHADPSLQPVNEYTAAVYTLRMFLENFASGVRRTYAYELVDDMPDSSNANYQDHYGLLQANFTPKPSFIALRNLLALVQNRYPASTSPLPVSTLQAPSDTRQLVLQKTPNVYDVIAWRENSIWSTSTLSPMASPSQPLVLSLPTATNAQVADPVSTQTLSPLNLAGGQISTTIGADPVVLQVTTGATARRLTPQPHSRARLTPRTQRTRSSPRDHRVRRTRRTHRIRPARRPHRIRAGRRSHRTRRH